MSIRNDDWHGDPQHDAQQLSAYALGALDDRTETAVREHVAWCRPCQGQLAEFQEAEVMLSTVPPEAFLEGPPDDGDLLLQRALRQMRAERTSRVRRRRLVMGLAAAAVAAALLGGGVLLGERSHDTPQAALPHPSPSLSASAGPPGTELASATDPGTGARMAVKVTPAAQWVKVSAAVVGVPAGQKCRLVVVGRDGATEVAGSWVVSQKAARLGTTLDGSAAIPPQDVAAVSVQNAEGRTYVKVLL